MPDTTREHILESIIVDLLDGQGAWWEIHEYTGLSEERSREIAEELKRIRAAYSKWNGVGSHA